MEGLLAALADSASGRWTLEFRFEGLRLLPLVLRLGQALQAQEREFRLMFPDAGATALAQRDAPDLAARTGSLKDQERLNAAGITPADASNDAQSPASEPQGDGATELPLLVLVAPGPSDYDAVERLCLNHRGGVVLLNDERLANTCREILLEGRASANNDLGDLARGGWGHHRTGVDGRLDPLRAAVAIGVLERLEETIELHRHVADRYVARLGGESQLQIPAPAPNAKPSWPAFPVRLDERFVLEDRDSIIAGLRRHEILAAAGWSFGPDLPIVAGPGCAEDQWPIAARLAARTIHLPCHPFMSEREVDLVCQTLLLMMKQTVFTRGE